jgi:hypothetical protein
MDLGAQNTRTAIAMGLGVGFIIQIGLSSKEKGMAPMATHV